MRWGAWPLCFAAFLVAGERSGPNPFDSIRHASYGLRTVAPNPFRLLVWNIARGTELGKIESGIRRHNPDICLLQEVDLNARRSGKIDVADALARELKMNYGFGLAYQELNQGTPGSPAWQGQADLARVPIQKTRILRFSHQTDFWEPHWYLPEWMPQRRHGGRIALISEIKAGGKTVIFYNLHLESRGPGYNRFEQLKEVLADADRFYAKQPVVIAGDLNTKYFAGKFVETLSEHGFQSCFGNRRERTHRILGDLDWIFTRGAQCGDAVVDRTAAGSDHFPVIAEIRISPGTGSKP